MGFLSACSLSAPGYEGKKSDHFDGDKFHNLAPYAQKSFWQVLKWRWSRPDSDWPDWIDNPVYPTVPKSLTAPDDLVVTYINHATVLIQIAGLNIITDPIWSERASPFTWIGPKRIRNPGIAFQDLPKIDVILISHNHYDHLDLPTLKRIYQRDKPLVLTGLGNDLLLAQNSIPAQALDWWQEVKVQNTPIIFVPAQHFSSRGLSDKMKTLWGGFVILTARGPVYFAGDTAWGPHFNLISQRFGSPYLAILPIGAYEPRYFMKASHVNPAEAVKAYRTLKAKYALAIHFDVFKGLADERFGQAVSDVKAALTKHQVSEQQFLVLNPGQWCRLGQTAECVAAIKK